MDRRLFVEKTLRTCLMAAFAGLAGCNTPGKTNSASGNTPTGGSNSTPTSGSGSTPGSSNSTSSSGTFPPATNPAPSPTPASSPAPTPSTSTPPAGAINVRDYGARGDGTTNDTDAFWAASQAINKAGGGTLYVPAGTYIVGKQTYAGPQTRYLCYISSPIIKIENCANPVVIQGEPGTVLRAPDGLKYGSFDPATGQPYNPPQMPFYNNAYMAEGPGTMISLSKNADVAIDSFELDGNIMGLELGGQWGDTGRQLPACGIVGLNNRKVTVRNVHTHHHGQDGVEFGYYNITASSPATPVTLENVVSEYNARQGLSWVGGIGLTATNCKFNHTGKARFASAPGAGVDIEPDDNSTLCINGVFNNCEFTNNHGCSVLADSGNSSNLTFNNCTVWGISNWSVWPRKPNMVFNGCDIHGAMVQIYSDNLHMDTSCKFINCTIDDGTHPTLGPTYIVPGNNLLIDMGGVTGGGVTFDGCTITSMRGMTFYTNGFPLYPTKLKNTTLVHGYPGNQNPRCLLQGVYLQNVHFKEQMPGTAIKAPMNIRECIVGPNVVVDGPYVTWRWAPYTGTIPQGQTPDTPANEMLSAAALQALQS